MTTTTIAIAVALGIAAAATLALGWLAIGYHAKQQLLSQKQTDAWLAKVESAYSLGFNTGDRHGYQQATRVIAIDLQRILNTPAYETALDAYDQLGHANHKLAKLKTYRHMIAQDTDLEPTLNWTDLFGYLPEITGGLTFDQWCAQRKANR